jgi:hypothetical protein
MNLQLGKAETNLDAMAIRGKPLPQARLQRRYRFMLEGTLTLSLKMRPALGLCRKAR